MTEANDAVPPLSGGTEGRNMRSQSQPVLPSNGQTDAVPSAALKPSVVLERAAALIEPVGAWTQRQYARDSNDLLDLYGDDPGAVCWCAIGAMQRAAGGHGFDHTKRPETYVERLTGCLAVSAWNDEPDRTQAEVVAALRKAAELARSEGQ